MKKILTLLGVVAILALSYFLYTSYLPPYTSPTESSTPVGELTKDYKSETYNFSLKMPADFEASEMSDESSDTMVLQNAAGDGIQIVISPFDEDTGSGYMLTKERILQDIPEMQMSDVQPVEIGDSYTGLAFKSDNEFFGGSSRAVWFVFRGHLYQINTYERLDELLKKMFATWHFN